MKTKYIERIKAWVEALRSGKYTQIRGMLSSLDEDGALSHCCLGVACEVYNQQTGIPSVETNNRKIGLPFAVAEWYGLGLDPELNSFNDGGKSTTRGASDWNDDYYATFDDIANMIEDTYL